jgi:uncharacterized protein DUF4349
MNKRLIQSLLVVLLLTLSAGCTGSDNAKVNPNPPATETPVPSFLLPVDRVILHSANYTITVKNPARALTDLQHAVEAAGGYVSSASSYSSEGSGGYASLNAKVPPEALPALSAAIDKLAEQVQSQNASVQDVTSDMLTLQQRYQDLAYARDELLWFLINDKDMDKLSTFGTLQELLTTELKSVADQLQSYEQQSKLSSLDITINQAGSVNPPAPIE